MRTCKLFCVLAAMLAVFSLSVSAMTAEAQAKAELDAARFSEYIDQFYPDGRTGPHAETIAMITRGLQRQEISLGSLVQVAETISSTAHSGLATDVEAELDMEETMDAGLDADAEADAEEEADVDADADADAETEADADAESEESADADASAETETEADAETEAEAETEAAAEEPASGASLLAAQQSATATAGVKTTAAAAAAVTDGGAGAGVDAASPVGGTMRGPNGCLLHNGVECNGERAGKCMGSVCHCIAGWTGLRCHVEWSLARLNPYTGLAEGSAQCASTVAQYLSSCN